MLEGSYVSPPQMSSLNSCALRVVVVSTLTTLEYLSNTSGSGTLAKSALLTIFPSSPRTVSCGSFTTNFFFAVSENGYSDQSQIWLEVSRLPGNIDKWHFRKAAVSQELLYLGLERCATFSGGLDVLYPVGGQVPGSHEVSCDEMTRF
jgi:hypothetical protein